MSRAVVVLAFAREAVGANPSEERARFLREALTRR